MAQLTGEKCIACRADSPRATEAEVRDLKPQIPEWALEREEEGHHPAILTEWGRVTVTLWTHKIRGLHRNDFIMAAKIDSLS